MTIDELAQEYEKQYNVLRARILALKPLLCIYSGNDLVLLRRRIKIYNDMADECKITASMLSVYYLEKLEEEIEND